MAQSIAAVEKIVVTLLHLAYVEVPMSFTTLSSREFNQDASKAKRAAQSGPVIITDRGRPAHVLLTFEHYKQLTHQPARIADLLAMPSTQDADFEAPSLRELAQAADLS
jgi:prevent-host-death family protein